MKKIDEILTKLQSTYPRHTWDIINAKQAIAELLCGELEKLKEGTPEELRRLGYGSERFMSGFNQAIQDCQDKIQEVLG